MSRGILYFNKYGFYLNPWEKKPFSRLMGYRQWQQTGSHVMIIQSINFLNEPKIDSMAFAIAHTHILPSIQYLYYYISFVYVDSALGYLTCECGLCCQSFRGIRCLHQGAQRSAQIKGPREGSTSEMNHHESLKPVITFPLSDYFYKADKHEYILLQKH
jgi:hypothetical protein